MAQHLQYLEVAVTQDKIPVTYRLLSRKADINVNAAKKLLYEFVSTTAHDVSATYCIIGEAFTSNSGNEPSQTIRIVDAEDLEEVKKQFKIISAIHVYSVQPSRLKDHTILVTANADIPKIPLQELSRYGIIKDNNILESKSRASAPAPQPQKAPTKLQDTKAEVKPKTVPAATAAKQEKPIAKPETEQSKPEHNRISSMFSAQKSQPAAKTQARPKAETVSKASNAKKPKKIHSDSEDENEEDEEEIDRRLAISSRQAQTAEDFWKDDEVMDVEKEENKEENLAETIEDQPIESDKREDKEAVSAATEPVEEQNTGTPKERRRLKRKVLKKRHYKDEKGFLVTEDAYEWESYSEDETIEPVLKRKAPPSSPAKNESKKSAKKGGAADQKSLLSFWGKK